jgi:hypothetical protein
MTESVRTGTETRDDVEAFTVLTLRYLDGGCSVEEIDQLKDALSAAAGSYDERFVDICRMQGELHEIYSSRRAALLKKETQTHDSAKQADAFAISAQADPCADTVMREISPEDTANPAPKTRA